MRREGDLFALRTARGKALDLAPRIPGLGDNVDADRRWLASVQKPWAVDLFCGAGGLSLGLQEAGFQVIAAADVDERAVETHAANLPGMAWRMDLADPAQFVERLRRRGVETVDLVAGGPPCQPFSRAGAAKLRSLVATGIREPKDERVDLWSTFLGVVDALVPRAVIMENVPDMARWAEGEILVNLMTALRTRGLEPEARVLKAWEYGVPQHRARLFVVATRQQRFSWPRRRRLVPLGDAIGDLPRIGAGQRERSLPYTSGPDTAFQRRARRGMTREAASVIWDHCSRDVRADDAEAFALLPQGGTYADLPARLRRYRSDIFDDKYKRLAWDEVSRTITAHIAKDGYWYIHPDQDRTLSLREAARVQTFPDRFRFAGHPTVQLRQIGNAVPPALAHAVGRRVLASLTEGQSSRFGATNAGFRDVGDADVDPWLRVQDPWLVLAGEVTLRRASPAAARRGWAELCECAGTPSAAVSAAGILRGRLVAAGIRSSRCDALIAIARSVMHHCGGNVPSSEAALMELPKVGQNVATAVRCFGWGQSGVVLDAATKRLAARVSGQDCTSAWTTRLEMYRLAGANGPDRTFNLAIRAITATSCVAGDPLCGKCPLVEVCRSRRLGAAREYERSAT